MFFEVVGVSFQQGGCLAESIREEDDSDDGFWILGLPFLDDVALV